MEMSQFCSLSQSLFVPRKVKTHPLFPRSTDAFAMPHGNKVHFLHWIQIFVSRLGRPYIFVSQDNNMKMNFSRVENVHLLNKFCSESFSLMPRGWHICAPRVGILVTHNTVVGAPNFIEETIRATNGE